MVDCYNPSLVLVQPRKTRPCLTERLLMARKESNQTKNNKAFISKGMILNYLTYFLSKASYEYFKKNCNRDKNYFMDYSVNNNALDHIL